MEANRTSNAGQGLGVAGFVLSLISFFISVIPVIGVWALIPGIIAVIFSAIAFTQAKKSNSPKGLSIAGLVISIIVMFIAFSQVYVGYKLVKFGKDSDKIEAFTKELQKELDEEFSEEEMKSLQETMEELEGEIEEISNETVKSATKAAKKALEQASEELEKTAEELEDSTN